MGKKRKDIAVILRQCPNNYASAYHKQTHQCCKTVSLGRTPAKVSEQ